ncbi:MAG: tetratricopeptide repeat protein [bacterium]|nr:tetratricopeptide repeat protein [bacterium]
MSTRALLPVITFLLLAIVGLGLYHLHQQQSVLGLATQRAQHQLDALNQIGYWEQVASASPTYRDAYVQLALLNAQLDNPELARVYFQKAIQLDPNWIIPSPLLPLLP